MIVSESFGNVVENLKLYLYGFLSYSPIVRKYGWDVPTRLPAPGPFHSQTWNSEFG